MSELPENAPVWFEYAESDYRAANKLADDDLCARQAAFLAQQAVEKTLKGMLVRAGEEVPKLHDLGELAERLRDVLPELEGLRPDLEWLTTFAVEGRYPTGTLAVTVGHAARAVHIAGQIRLMCLPGA